MSCKTMTRERWVELQSSVFKYVDSEKKPFRTNEYLIAEWYRNALGEALSCIEPVEGHPDECVDCMNEGLGGPPCLKCRHLGRKEPK